MKWLDNDRFVVANEGDYKGGSRGFTIFSKNGEVLYESGPAFEYEAAKAGHYPESRNKKGIEPEGVEVGDLRRPDKLHLRRRRARLARRRLQGHGRGAGIRPAAAVRHRPGRHPRDPVAQPVRHRQRGRSRRGRPRPLACDDLRARRRHAGLSDDRLGSTRKTARRSAGARFPRSPPIRATPASSMRRRTRSIAPRRRSSRSTRPRRRR